VTTPPSRAGKISLIGIHTLRLKATRGYGDHSPLSCRKDIVYWGSYAVAKGKVTVSVTTPPSPAEKEFGRGVGVWGLGIRDRVWGLGIRDRVWGLGFR
jgi:tRNA A37 threonylcarbamoyladenosine modification protein TsaB